MQKCRPEQEIFDDLGKLCASPGYAHAIAYICYRDNLVVFEDVITPDDMQKLYSNSRLVRTEISTIVGLMCRHERDYSLPAPEIIEKYVNETVALLHEMHQAMTASWFANFDPKSAEIKDFKPFSTGENLREPIFYGGESAYSFQYRDLALPKYRQDDEWLLANKGFDIQAAHKVVSAIGDMQNYIQRAVFGYNQSAPSSEQTMLLPAFLFTSEQVTEASGIEIGLVGKILSAFSISESFRNDGFHSLHDYNALNAAPIMSIGDDQYILLQYYSLVAALYEAPIYWMGEDKSYQARAFAHRGQFAEIFAFERLVSVFGKDNVFTNVHIPDKKGKERGEIDVLVVFGGRAIVLQAKTKRLTVEARKGNDLQIKDDFKKAVQDSYNQAYDCSLALLDPNCELLDSTGKPIVFSSKIKQVFPVCVVADHYPALDLQVRQFLKSTNTSIIMPPLVSDVFALDAIAEMLDTPFRFLSYLNLRARFGEKLNASHELTLLSDHIKRNLWADDGYTMVMLGDDIAVDLDVAMSVRRDGLPGKRTPDGILTRFRSSSVGKLVDELEAKPSPEMTDLGLLLLELSEPTVATLSRAIDKTTEGTRRDGQRHDFTIGLGDASSGITVHCVPYCNDEVVSRLRMHCETRKYTTKASSWFGIVYNPDGSLALCAKVEYPWEYNEKMEEFVKTMPESTSPERLHSHLIAGVKTGRNELCPCGSKRKFKKCCLNRYRG